MSGWIIAVLLAGLVFLGLWRSGRCSTMALELALAALLVGLAGYAWQGKPDMVGRPFVAAR